MAAEHFLESIQITRIKNLADVEIRFDREKYLTALMGPNGFGKSTILHFLAASFRPTEIRQRHVIFQAGEARRYSEFFPGTPHGSWAGTSLKIVTRIKRGDSIDIVPFEVSKKEVGAWQPQQDRKIDRETYFIGVTSALPEIEVKRDTDDVSFGTVELSDDVSKKLKKYLSYVFNRDYTNILDHVVSTDKRFIGLTHRGISYSALSMGAGEQRVFRILKTLLSSQNGALLLIDEIDLLLHSDALDRLLETLSKIATKKKVQIVFTSHRESVIESSQHIAIRHIYNSVKPHLKTYCFNETKPGAIQRLTGKTQALLSVCCEDDVAAAIIKRVAQEVGIAQYVKLQLFGSWRNCFTLAAAVTWEGKNAGNTLFILDGDIAECQTPEQRKKILGELMTGTTKTAKLRREQALSAITQFAPAANESPEKVLYDLVRSVAPDDLADRDIVEAFHSLIGCV